MDNIKKNPKKWRKYDISALFPPLLSHIPNLMCKCVVPFHSVIHWSEGKPQEVAEHAACPWHCHMAFREVANRIEHLVSSMELYSCCQETESLISGGRTHIKHDWTNCPASLPTRSIPERCCNELIIFSFYISFFSNLDSYICSMYFRITLYLLNLFVQFHVSFNLVF